MFRDIESQDFFYLVGLANHETVVLAENINEAASIGVKKILKKHGNETNVSMAVVVTKIKENTDSCEVFSFSEVLGDIGLFSLAKEMSNISDFLLDTGKKGT
jgi:hypothetical protein